MSAIRRFVTRRRRQLVLLATAGVMFALWFAVWTRVLPLKPRVRLRVPAEHVFSDVSSDEKVLVTRFDHSGVFGGGPGPIHAWDTKTGQLIGTFLENETDIWDAKVSPDGRWLASWHGPIGSCWLSYFDVTSGERFASVGAHHFKFSFSSTSAYLALAFDEESLTVFRTGSREPIKTLKNPDCGWLFSQFRFSPGGNRLAYQWRENDVDSIKVLDLLSGEVVLTINNAQVPVEFSPDGMKLAVASPREDGEGQEPMRLIDLTSGREQVSFVGLDGRVSHMFCSPDGNSLAGVAGGPEFMRAVRWSLLTGKTLGRYDGDNWSYVASNLDPESRHLKRDYGKVLDLVDLATGRELKGIDFAHYGGSLAMSLDGKYVASMADSGDESTVGLDWFRNKGTSDGEEHCVIRLYDMEQAKVLGSFEASMYCLLRFTPAGTSLIVYDMQGHLEIWDVPPRRPNALLLTLAAVPSLLFTFLLWWRFGR